jgi:hypothetical protein
MPILIGYNWLAKSRHARLDFTSPTKGEWSPRDARRERAVRLAAPSPALRACLSHFVGEADWGCG